MRSIVEETRQDESDAMTLRRSGSPETVRNARKIAEEQWTRAAAVLSSRPSLMTHHILLLVLKNRPPVHVVEYMLSINPRAADIPEKGPSALQVAVRYNASLAVIRALVKACPLALVATHTGYDPLMYAKIWRRDETELLELLSQPLSYWMNQQDEETIVAAKEHPKLPVIAAATGSTKPRPTTTTNATARTNAVKEEEFNNIKAIAATIVRAQKRQAHTIQVHKHQVEASLQGFQAWNAQERAKQLEKLEKHHADHFRTQLIALDMKEKAMLARVKSMERRINKTMELSKQVRDVRERRQDATLHRLEHNVAMLNGTLNNYQVATEKRLSDVEVRLGQECMVNDYFRNDTRLQLDQLDLRSHSMDAGSHMTPIVYATPFLKDDDQEDELDSVEPLCPKPVNGRRTTEEVPRKEESETPWPFQLLIVSCCIDTVMGLSKADKSSTN